MLFHGKKSNAPRDSRRCHAIHQNLMLVAVNLLVIGGIALVAATYSHRVVNQKNAVRLDSFRNSVEVLRSVSESYLRTEKGYVDDWVAYITAQDMTAEEAMEYIATTNTYVNRVAHLVDVDDWSARSTEWYNGVPWVHRYEKMVNSSDVGERAFLEKMKRLMDSKPGDVMVLGKYRVGEASQRTVVSVGAPVPIRQADGTHKKLLLLRLVPVEYLQSSWVFPATFDGAEVSLIARDGGYVVQSPSMRSSSFLEFIRGYNFQDNYNRVNDLAAQLYTTDSGLLEYKNSAGVDCFYYYTAVGVDPDLFVMGYAPVSKVYTSTTDWSIVTIVCGALLLLMLIDGGHILSINRKLRGAVETAERASQAKTQFLSTMSHDIRTPMNAVLGMTEVAKHHLDDPDVVAGCLDKVSRSGNHLLTLINDILDISKVESGKMPLNPCPFSLRDAMQEVYAMAVPGARDKNITLELQIGELPEDTLLADPLRLRQVLLNLLTNAVKYTENGGHVTFGVEERRTGSGRAALHFTVADNGIGMSEEFQKTMYASFSRGTDSRINTIQGSGLGLAIAKQMVELMHGTIDCQSQLGKGTVFHVNLEVPVASGASSPQKDSEEEITELTGMRVLVAEDNEMNWQIIQALLKEYGVLTDRAINGRNCVEQLENPQSPRYDVVLMDIQMPQMNGREATRCLRASTNPYVRDIPVVAMTADAFAEDIHACEEAGMDGHISKPIDMARVLRYLSKAKNGTLHRKEEQK